MAVRTVTVVSNGTARDETVRVARVVTVANTHNTVQQGVDRITTEVVRPGGTVANIAYGTTLPPNPSQGDIFILIT